MERILRNTWAEIDLDKLSANVSTLRKHIGSGIAIAAVLKANAYGHGAVEIAKHLESLNIEYIALATLSEAIELRQHGIKTPLLVMGYTDNTILEYAVKHDITLTVFELSQVEILSEMSVIYGKTSKIHIKVDTGLNRLGKKPTDEFAEEISQMAKLPNIEIEGIFSHLRLIDKVSDTNQFDMLVSFIEKLDSMGITFKYSHISDGISAVKYREFAMNMVRPGAVLYGYTPSYQKEMISVQPIMSFKTKVTRVEKLSKGEPVGYSEDYKASDNTVIATLPAGYADGYTRDLSNIGQVTIRGRRARVIGVICMDQMMVDVSHIPGVQPGDEVVLFGDGDNQPSVEELALLLDTNRNAVISGISRRVPRAYYKNNNICKIVDYLINNGGDNI